MLTQELEQEISSQGHVQAASLQVGHWVLVGCDCVVCTANRAFYQIERTTEKQIVVNGRKFHRSNGRELSNGWHRQVITIPTPELITSIKVANAKRALRAMTEKITQEVGILTGNASVTAKTLEKVMTAHNQLQAVLATLEAN